MSFWDRFRFKKKPFKEPREEVGKTNEVEEKKEREILSPSVFSNILIRPYLSEKSSVLAEQSKFVFEVAPQATKKQIFQAIKAVYGVSPLQVHILKIQRKKVRYGRTLGQTKIRKKAVVTLGAGEKIDIYK